MLCPRDPDDKWRRVWMQLKERKEMMMMMMMMMMMKDSLGVSDDA